MCLIGLSHWTIQSLPLRIQNHGHQSHLDKWKQQSLVPQKRTPTTKPNKNSTNLPEKQMEQEIEKYIANKTEEKNTAPKWSEGKQKSLIGRWREKTREKEPMVSRLTKCDYSAWSLERRIAICDLDCDWDSSQKCDLCELEESSFSFFFLLKNRVFRMSFFFLRKARFVRSVFDSTTRVPWDI